MKFTLQRLTRTAAGVIVLLGIVLGGLLGASAPARADQVLTPDPQAWCSQQSSNVYGLQQTEDDWQVQYQVLAGNAYQNNWRCVYRVWPTIPAGDDTFSLVPPFSQSVPMDWNGMCNAQFPGASAVWIQAPASGVYGAPWQCQAPPGVSYDPAEQWDGTHNVLN